ncbi:1503_t:CDS:2 [Entrophospora sp. SA101]|nr:1503_t:CDS:2 [Entrophospora sp. SA101]
MKHNLTLMLPNINPFVKENNRNIKQVAVCNGCDSIPLQLPLAQQSINVSSHTYRSTLPNEVPKPYDLVVPNDSFPTDIRDEDANYNHLIAGLNELN